MSAPTPVTFAVDADAVGWIVFDTPDAKANVFDRATQEALAAAIGAAEASTARAVVIAGAKERIFIAGADLRWLQNLPDSAAAVEFSRCGQALFQRVAALPVPTICAIHGACAGGGFELALACDWRLATDAPATQIGLPETSIGTIPGWGGCVRLPRLVGFQAALEHIIRGQLISVLEARRLGFVDDVVAAATLKTQAKAVALRLAGAGKPRRPAPAEPPAGFAAAIRQATQERTQSHQPAPLAAIAAVEETSGRSVDDALLIEARHFGDVTSGPVCKNLIHVFFLREAAKKRTLSGWFPSHRAGTAPAPPKPVRRVGIVGAGVMGSGIAHWLATRGFEVVLRDVQGEFIARALGVIRELLDESVKRRKITPEEAGVVFGRIRTTTAWEGFADCDLIIEAIVEHTAEKQRLFSELAAVVRPDALLASNTSALPIEEIAGHVPNPERVLGIHFFNPVSRMPLVEIILSPRTAAGAAESALGFVKILGKSPVVCRSSPGFLVTRVLFFYLNAAVRLWENGATTAAIDDALRDFGWPMGPLRLIDEVGVDVTALIFGEMVHYYPDRFVTSKACTKLLDAGLRGRKNGTSRGFYRYAGAQDTSNEAETRSIAGAPPVPAARSEGEAATIAADLMTVMVDEARRCLTEGVVHTADELDFALLTGTGFPAFRGGLMRWADSAR